MTFRIKSARNARLIVSTDIREHDVQYAGSNHTKGQRRTHSDNQALLLKSRIQQEEKCKAQDLNDL